MNTSEKILYLMAGTGIGAAFGILFAPRSGQETRQTLTSQAQRGVDLVSEKVEQGKKFLQEKAAGEGMAGDKATIRNVAERGKQVYERGKQALNESVESVRNRINESVEAGKQEYQMQRDFPSREHGGY